MFSNPFFDDRADAGEKLAEAVLGELGKLNLTAQEAVKPIVYALPRGGLPVAVPIARRLGCPLDVVVAKKITRPDNLELAMGLQRLTVTSSGKSKSSRIGACKNQHCRWLKIMLNLCWQICLRDALISARRGLWRFW